MPAPEYIGYLLWGSYAICSSAISNLGISITNLCTQIREVIVKARFEWIATYNNLFIKAFYLWMLQSYFKDKKNKSKNNSAKLVFSSSECNN